MCQAIILGCVGAVVTHDFFLQQATKGTQFLYQRSGVETISAIAALATMATTVPKLCFYGS